MTSRKPSERSQDVVDIPIAVENRVEGEGGETADEIRRTVAALMPWGVSILAHTVLVVVAFFLVWQTIVTKPGEEPFVPTLTQSPTVTTPKAIDPQDEMQDAGAPPFVPVVAQVDPIKPVPGVGQPVAKVPFEPSIVSSKIGDKRDIGTGRTTRIGLPDGEDDPLGPKRFVFIIDASGSMVDVLPFVINELKQSVASQAADREATILIFSGDGVFEVPGGGGVRGLRPLTAKFKQDIMEWVTLSNHRFGTGGRGSQHVEAALERGLSYKPQAIYLLSDNLTGGGQGATQHELFQSDILDRIKAYSDGAGSARINTIQFLYEDPLVRIGLPGTLQLIAEQTRGTYRFVSQQDLLLR